MSKHTASELLLQSAASFGAACVEVLRMEKELKRLQADKGKYKQAFVETYANGGELCSDCQHSKESGSGWGHTCEVDDLNNCPAVEQLQEDSDEYR